MRKRLSGKYWDSIRIRRVRHTTEGPLLVAWLQELEGLAVSVLSAVSPPEDVESVNRYLHLGFDPVEIVRIQKKESLEPGVSVQQTCIRWAIPTTFENTPLTCALERLALVRGVLLPAARQAAIDEDELPVLALAGSWKDGGALGGRGQFDEYKLATLKARLSYQKAQVHALTTGEEFGAFADPVLRRGRRAGMVPPPVSMIDDSTIFASAANPEPLSKEGLLLRSWGGCARRARGRRAALGLHAVDAWQNAADIPSAQFKGSGSGTLLPKKAK
ncbi:hypothetical protein Emed_006317 [Eimeria media]